MHTPLPAISLFFFFNDTATTEIYTLSLHDALPISTGTTVPEGNKTKLESLVSFVHSVRKNLSSSTLLSADAPCNILRRRARRENPDSDRLARWRRRPRSDGAFQWGCARRLQNVCALSKRRAGAALDE